MGPGTGSTLHARYSCRKFFTCKQLLNPVACTQLGNPDNTQAAGIYLTDRDYDEGVKCLCLKLYNIAIN